MQKDDVLELTRARQLYPFFWIKIRYRMASGHGSNYWKAFEYLEVMQQHVAFTDTNLLLRSNQHHKQVVFGPEFPPESPAVLFCSPTQRGTAWALST